MTALVSMGALAAVASVASATKPDPAHAAILDNSCNLPTSTSQPATQ